MPKPKSSEEARILRYFREEDLMKVQLLGSLILDIVRTRTPKAVAPKGKTPKKPKGPEVVASGSAGVGQGSGPSAPAA